MPAYRLRGLPQDDSGTGRILPRVEADTTGTRVFPEGCAHTGRDGAARSAPQGPPLQVARRWEGCARSSEGKVHQAM
ncbi:hypothetical protein DB35_21235 [Streptomyces abyssalis]|uniref:Uncharacterized protein n=1 Tax=Streptomyces abyssalis TaxID=933944 RepID=A0A1E7JUB6_9ACTN|nr:hypothetical protein DB35_21235 [Streptomyces abyssalis]OEU93566.1 hypothetical protein AN215_01885 [Streptomyces abyssalis]OEV07796.1 hypothetical protein AN219_31735 [Streptomyces nanshensis]